MEVILLEKMRNLGVLGDKIKVKPGYARNYLIPQGKAVYANKENIAKFEQRRAELEQLAADRYQRALQHQKTIESVGVIELVRKAGDEGKLFGSINNRDIVLALEKLGVEVEKKQIQLPEGSLRQVGEYEINIELESDVNALIKINVVPES